MPDSQKPKISYSVIALVAALALLGVVVLTVAEASCVTGYFHSGNGSAFFTALEKSEGRCFAH